MRLPSPLLAVTDRHGHPRPLPETVRAVLDGGGRWIWFRDRDLPPDARLRLGAAVAARVRAAGGFLTVGGDAALASALEADGLHLGSDADPERIAEARRIMGPACLIGLSAHAPGDAVAAAAGGADYVTLSPIFASASKPGYGPALGTASLAAAHCAGIPVVALGGIAAANAGACRAAGAHGIAVMGGVMRPDDPAAAARALLDAWSAARRGSAET